MKSWTFANGATIHFTEPDGDPFIGMPPVPLTYEYMQAAPVGHRIAVERGEYRGIWVKLGLDHTGQLNPQLQGDQRPLWANIETGTVRHFSWLVDA